MPATLSSFWNDEVTRLKNLLVSANASLTTASQTENTAATTLAATGKAVDKAKADVDAARKALAGIPMPADSDPLVLAMRKALRDLNKAQADQVTQDEALRRARANRAQLTAVVASLNQELDNANAQYKSEKSAADQRLIWTNAAKAAPLKDLPALATTALTKEAAAVAKIAADFPSNADVTKDFLARVRARRDLAAKVSSAQADILSETQSNVKTWDESSTRASAKIAALRRDFDAKVATLKAFFDAPARVKQAQAQLATLSTLSASLLTTAQKNDLLGAAPHPASLQGDREAALVLLGARDKAQSDLLDVQEAYAKLLLTTLLANPGKTEADLLISDTALKNKKKDVTDAETALSEANKDATFSPANKDLLRDWFAAVPDVLWENFEVLENARADLKAVKAIVPATLLSDIDAAEASLITQLQAARDEQLSITQRQLSLQQDETVVSIVGEVAARRLQSASRFVELI